MSEVAQAVASLDGTTANVRDGGVTSGCTTPMIGTLSGGHQAVTGDRWVIAP